MASLPTLFVANTVEIILGLLGVAIFIGSTIFSAVRKKAEQEEQRRRELTGRPAAAAAAAPDEELGAQRQRHQEAMAARMGGGTGTAQPTNLNVQQLRQRAQAEAAYAQRAAQLRAQQAQQARQARQQPTVISTPPVEPNEDDQGLLQRERERVARDQARREQEEIERRKIAEKQARQRAAAQRQAQARQQAVQRQRQAEARGQAYVGESDAGPRLRDQLQAAGVSSAAAVVVPAPPASVRLSKGVVRLSGASLRDAIILSEVLGPPVSQRQAEA